MVLARAQLQHGRAEQAPLHTRLDLQAGIGGDEFFEAGDVGAVVLLPAETLRKGPVHGLVLHEEVQLAEGALAVRVHAEAVIAPERGVFDHLARLAADVAPRTEQQIGDPLGVDAGFGGLGRGVRGGGRSPDGRARARGGRGGTDGGVGHSRHLSTLQRDATHGRCPTTTAQTSCVMFTTRPAARAWSRCGGSTFPGVRWARGWRGGSAAAGGGGRGTDDTARTTRRGAGDVAGAQRVLRGRDPPAGRVSSPRPPSECPRRTPRASWHRCR